jgi:hypothetical protein
MEFVLREKNRRNCTERNISLGNEYEFYNRATTPDMVMAFWRDGHDGADIPKDLFGVLVSSTGLRYLFQSQEYFVMTDSGQTFERIKA